MMIITSISQSIKSIRSKKKRPRRAVVAWMRRNPNWCREIIAMEWERQTGQDWLTLMADSSA